MVSSISELGDVEKALLTEFYDRALKDHAGRFMSVPSSEPEATHPLVCFQLVSSQSNNRLVPLHDDDEEEFRYRLTISVSEIWSCRNGMVEVVSFRDPDYADLFDLVPAKDHRNRLLVYKEVPSDVEGCTCLVEGVPVSPLCKLRDRTCPCLCPLEELEGQGWTIVERAVTHVPGGQSRSTGAAYHPSAPISSAYWSVMSCSETLASSHSGTTGPRAFMPCSYMGNLRFCRARSTKPVWRRRTNTHRRSAIAMS